jgi:uncharacterized protein (DUF1800 family)
LQRGVEATRATVLERGLADPGLDSVVAPVLADLGPIPTTNTTAFWNAIDAGNTHLVTWWLDRMVVSHHPLAERMTWFWHGHFATSMNQ